MGDAALAEAERARAALLRRPQARRQFVAARRLLRCLLAEELGCQPGEVPLAVDRFGKPYLAGRRGPAFNLSHSNGLIAVAIRPARPAVQIYSIDVVPGYALAVARVPACAAVAEFDSRAAVPTADSPAVELGAHRAVRPG